MQREVLAGQAGNDGFGCCQIRTSCFRVWKTEAAKKHLAIDWLATVAGEWKWKMLAGWRRKGMCWPAKPETKMPPAGKCAPRICAPEKFALAFFCLPAEFYFAVFGSRCGIPWKDQT